MPKRHGAISGNRKIKHPHKTQKRKAAKQAMLASRTAKQMRKEDGEDTQNGRRVAEDSDAGAIPHHASAGHRAGVYLSVGYAKNGRCVSLRRVQPSAVSGGDEV